jgi:nitrite reductase/ring-hydroxylating ferredoxin subunit
MTTADERQGDTGCGECPVATSRRAFLRDVGLSVLGALALTAVGSPGIALAESVSTIAPSRRAGALRSYGIPAADSIAIDESNDVILARWQGRVYAFSLKCPHRGARLEWRTGEQRVFCPKHKARFRPDGMHDSGRQSRDLDRYDISRQGTAVVVNLDVLRRVDQDPRGWEQAVLVLG